MADFRVKDELLGDGCVAAAFGSCSSAAHGDEDAEDVGDGGDQFVRRRRRSEIEGEDIAETSAAARRHSRILGRWVARQAEEMMITSLERRNRESELLALARLHTVSMLDASFLRESRRAQQQQQQQLSVDRPVVARASSVLRRWRELEDEAAAAAVSAGGQRSPRNYLRNGDDSRGSRSGLDNSARDNSEAASEIIDSEYGGRGVLGTDDDRGSSREQSPEVWEGAEAERERVRQIARGWLMTESRLAEASLRVTEGSESPRGEWLGERERQRVRMVREWVQLTSQESDSRSSRRDSREGDGSVTDNSEGQPERSRRELLRIRGRQARMDLIMRLARDRERELQGLLEHQAVSRFPHRSRIQSVLRGRFLRSGGSIEDNQRPSVAARELVQIRQRHPVSLLRQEFHLRQDNNDLELASSQSDVVNSDSISEIGNVTTVSSAVEVSEGTLDQSQVGNLSEMPQTTETVTSVQIQSTATGSDAGWLETTTQAENWLEENVEQDEREWQLASEVRLSGWHDDTGEEYSGNWQEDVNQDWHRENQLDEDAQNNDLPEVHDFWNEDDSRENETNWPDQSSDQHSPPVRRFGRFTPSDDDNVYSLELRELLSRRSVSNLLHSEFRGSLDQLIQSYIQRQESDPFSLDLQTTINDSDVVDGDEGGSRDDRVQDSQDSITRPRMPPSPPLPPPQPLWHSELRHSWSRHGVHRSEIEWDIINDLRTDMSKLQQAMIHMQQMLEACMEMQLELQRAVRQEVSAALNCTAGEQVSEDSSQEIIKWSHVRKGICCICCDSHIDSLLYRCGHMCTCSKCANELLRTGGKCPLCRAPIIEVIRAYSIL